ncbi:phage tail tape measure protein [Formosa undariae]|uniref:Phage tail tape measure protein n=1 Tax=Formosa undariae TaxID=1325436 RepID=A0ABV5F6L5_9FLAO
MAKRILDEEMRFSIVVNGNEAQKELLDLEKSTRKLNEENKQYRLEQKRLVAQGKENTAEYKTLTATIKDNTATIKSNKTQMALLQKQIGVTGLTMAQLTTRASQLRLQLRNMVPGSADYNRLNADLKSVNARLKELKTNAQATKLSLGGIADGFNRYAALGASVIATLTGIVLSIQQLIDYNGKLSDAQSNVQKTTGLTKDEVDELTKSFGLLKTRTARIELLQLAEEAGRLGIEGVKNVKDFVEVANQLKVALGDDLSDTAIREVGKMVNVYKVGEKTGKDFKNSMLALGSAINEVSASGSNNASFLVDYLKRQAGIAAQANVSAEDNLAYAATFDEIGQSVEVSATAMNKVWMDMFKNTDLYANIAGETLEDFTTLLKTDANAAMLKFLKGLNGNNAGLRAMLIQLEDLEVGGDRGVAALSALANNTELLEKRQLTSNESLEKATSLTDEYALKNNNLAGVLDKIKKKLIGAFSSETVIAGLTGLTSWFGKLIGAIEDVNEQFDKEVKVSYETAKANRQLVSEGQNLLKKYEELNAVLEPTIEQKEELDTVMFRLKNMFGESVIEIDKETGAYILNTAAVREQIRLKRISADEEASTLVSRRQGVKDAIADLEAQKKAAESKLDQERKGFELVNKQDIEAIKNASSLSAIEKQQQLERLEGYQSLDQARLKSGSINQELYNKNKKLADLNAKLKELEFTEADADAFFATPEVPTGDAGPKEGDVKTIGDVTYKYSNGKWIAVINKPTGTPDKTIDTAKKRAEELLKLQRASEDARLELIQDSFEREMAIEEANHRRKIEDLNNQTIGQGTINSAIAKGDTSLADDYIAKNKELNAQIESENQLHEIRKATILENGITNNLQTRLDAFNQAEIDRETAFNNELVALGDNEEAKKALTQQYNKDRLVREKLHLATVKAEFFNVMNAEEFKGFDLEVLSEDQVNAIKARLKELGLSISEINALLGKMSGKGGEDDLQFIGGQADILGFTPEQWDSTFANLDTTVGKLNAAVLGMRAMGEAFAMYQEFVAAGEARELADFEKTTDIKKSRHQELLDQGMITERQYNEGVAAMDADLEKKKAEIAYNQAKREKEAALMAIAINTATAIMGIWAQVPKFDFGISAGILTGVVGALGLAQAVTVAKAPLPAKGYEQGLYQNIQREQDGKVFNAKYGGTTTSGMVNEPTYFLAGEGGKNWPEMVIDGGTMKQMNPYVKEALYGEVARMKGYETGYYQNQTSTPEFSAQSNSSDPLLLATLTKTNELLDALNKNGVMAVLSTNFKNLKELQEEQEKYNKFKQKRKI